VSFPEPDTSSGYAVLEQLAQRELKDVPVSAASSGAQPALDYDGLFAKALQGQPVVLGYNVADDHASRACCPAPSRSRT
jgi:adenylate cyclase